MTPVSRRAGSASARNSLSARITMIGVELMISEMLVAVDVRIAK